MAVDTLSEALWSSVKTVYDKFLYVVSYKCNIVALFVGADDTIAF